MMIESKVSIRALAGFVAVAMVAFLCAMSPRVALADDAPDPFEQAVEVDLDDGEYSVDVSMTGGSGRASIDSPALMTVQGGKAAATIRWSSPNYDYMLINDDKYTPVNEDPMANSEFQIPILAFDEPFAVVGDTTAMSTPHEVDYELTFNLDSVVLGAPEVAEAAEDAEATAASDTSSDTSAPAEAAAATDAPASSESGGVSPIAIIVIVVVVALIAGIAIGVVRGRKNR